MPGSILACQSLSGVYDSYYNVYNGNNASFKGLTIDAANDTFNVDTNFGLAFPFNTGDVVYYGNSSGNFNLVTRYYAIKISTTSIKVATTYANAIAGIAVDLTVSSTNTNLSFFQHQISNVFLMAHTGPSLPYTNIFNKNNWQSLAFSTINFSITENIRFDFTIESFAFAGISTISGSYAIGLGIDAGTNVIGRESTGIGNTNRFSVGTGLRSDVRITVLNRIITVSKKETNGTYTTVYTTTTIGSLESFRFFAYFGINNTKLQNCVITYL